MITSHIAYNIPLLLSLFYILTHTLHKKHFIQFAIPPPTPFPAFAISIISLSFVLLRPHHVHHETRPTCKNGNPHDTDDNDEDTDGDDDNFDVDGRNADMNVIICLRVSSRRMYRAY